MIRSAVEGRLTSPPRLLSPYYAALFTLAHLALCAAAIRLRPASEMEMLSMLVFSSGR